MSLVGRLARLVLTHSVHLQQQVLVHRMHRAQRGLWKSRCVLRGRVGFSLLPLLLGLPSPNVAHVLLAGTTGSGKTALARTMIASLAAYNSQRQLQFVLVDPKGRGLMPFAGLPHLLGTVVERFSMVIVTG